VHSPKKFKAISLAVHSQELCLVAILILSPNCRNNRALFILLLYFSFLYLTGYKISREGGWLAYENDLIDMDRQRLSGVLGHLKFKTDSPATDLE